MFVCVDPEAACVNDDDITVEMFENCDVGSIGDAVCNQANNNEECRKFCRVLVPKLMDIIMRILLSIFLTLLSTTFVRCTSICYTHTAVAAVRT